MLAILVGASSASFLCLINYFVYVQAAHPMASIVFLTTGEKCPLGMSPFSVAGAGTIYGHSRFARISNSGSGSGGAAKMAFMPKQFVKRNNANIRGGTDTKALQSCDASNDTAGCLEVEYPENILFKKNNAINNGANNYEPEGYLPPYVNMLACKLE